MAKYDLTLNDLLKALPNDEFVAKGIEETINESKENKEKTDGNTTDIEKLKGEVEQLDQQITAIDGQIQTLQGQVGQLQGDVTQLQNNVTTLQADVLDLQGRLTQAESDIGQLKTDVQNLQIDVNKLKQDLTDLTDRVSANEQSISDIEIDINNIDQDIAEIKNQKSNYRFSSSSITIPANSSLDVFTYTTEANGLHGVTAMCDAVDSDLTLEVNVNGINAFSLALTERTTTPQIPVTITTPFEIALTLKNTSASSKTVSPYVSLSVLRF